MTDVDYLHEVCIVGNGGSAKDVKAGAVIDKFGLIVRFNRYRTDPPYDEYVGTKTHVWVCTNANTLIDEVHHPRSYIEVILAGQYEPERSHGYERMVKLCREASTILTFWPQHIVQLQYPDEETGVPPLMVGLAPGAARIESLEFALVMLSAVPFR